jgi:hypothetical protein
VNRRRSERRELRSKSRERLEHCVTQGLDHSKGAPEHTGADGPNDGARCGIRRAPARSGEFALDGNVSGERLNSATCGARGRRCRVPLRVG